MPPRAQLGGQVLYLLCINFNNNSQHSRHSPLYHMNHNASTTEHSPSQCMDYGPSDAQPTTSSLSTYNNNMRHGTVMDTVTERQVLLATSHQPPRTRIQPARLRAVAEAVDRNRSPSDAL